MRLTGVLFGPKTGGRTPEDIEREYGWSTPETPAAPALVPTGGEELMERVCFLLRVRADRLEEYKARHRAVWPEMLDALRETGWTNYSLFLA